MADFGSFSREILFYINLFTLLSQACPPPLVFRSLPHAVLSKMVGIDSLAHEAAFASFFFFLIGISAPGEDCSF